MYVILCYVQCTGAVKVWDPRQKDEPVANMAPAEGQDTRDCWCVAFGKFHKWPSLPICHSKYQM